MVGHFVHSLSHNNDNNNNNNNKKKNNNKKTKVKTKNIKQKDPIKERR